MVASADIRLVRSWHWISLLFGANHGSATTPLIFATTLLDEQVGYAGSALLYASTCLGSLFLAVPVVATLGRRWGLFTGLALYCVYLAAFVGAAATPPGSWVQWAIFLPGSAVGGVAAGILWTSQGSFLNHYATAWEACGQVQRQQATASLAGTFAAYYLILEVACKLAVSAALHFEVKTWVVFAVALLLAVAAASAALVVPVPGESLDSDTTDNPPDKQVLGKLFKAVVLWKDPCLWLLSFTNLTFGFSAALMNGYVNAHFTKPQLGKEWVGFYATSTALTGALASPMFGFCAGALGSKGLLVLVGGACFASIPAIVLLADLDSWGYFLLLLYVLQGLGRAVYESINKGIFADFFPGQSAEGAFANVMMQTTLAFAFCFFFSSMLSRKLLAAIVLFLALATFPHYLAAAALRKRRNREGEFCKPTLRSNNSGSGDSTDPEGSSSEE